MTYLANKNPNVAMLLRTYVISALVFLGLIMLLVGVDDWVVGFVVVGFEVVGVVSSTVVSLWCAC